MKSPPKARRRRPLSRQRVLQAALVLAGRGGLEAVTMRKLARALGVEPMSLYNHVGGKDELLDGMVEAVLAEFDLPSPGPGWEASVRSLAVSVHEALLRHPWACLLVIAPRSGGVALGSRLHYIESLLATFGAAGFSPELAYYAYHAVDSYVLGFTMWQLGHQVAVGAGDAEAVLRTLPLAELPSLAEHIRQHELLDGRPPSDFDFGLDILIDGLRRRLASGTDS